MIVIAAAAHEAALRNFWLIGSVASSGSSRDGLGIEGGDVVLGDDGGGARRFARCVRWLRHLASSPCVYSERSSSAVDVMVVKNSGNFADQESYTGAVRVRKAYLSGWVTASFSSNSS